jgi:hypothetical protein
MALDPDGGMRFDLGMPGKGAVVALRCADLDGRSGDEVIVATRDGSLVVLRSNGTLFHSRQLANTLSDVVPLDDREVRLAAIGDSTAVFLDAEGRTLYTHSLAGDGLVTQALTLGAGQSGLLVGNSAGRLELYCRGERRWSQELREEVRAVVRGRFDDTGEDSLVALLKSRVVGLGSRGGLLDQWPMDAGQQLLTSGDLDGDGYDEVVTAGGEGTLVVQQLMPRAVAR